MYSIYLFIFICLITKLLENLALALICSILYKEEKKEDNKKYVFISKVKTG